MNTTFRGGAAVLSTLMFVCAAHAQTKHPDTTTKVDVRVINATWCTKPKVIYLVLDGRDGERFTLDPDPKKACRWSGDIPPERRFDIEAATFSLRLRGGRTDCRKAIAQDPESGPDSIASLTFPDNPAKTRQVALSTDPGITVSYVRTLPADAGGKACRDHAEIRESDTLWDVRLRGETLSLYLGDNDPPSKVPGLIVDDKLLSAAKKKPLNVDALAGAFLRQCSVRAHQLPENCSDSYKSVVPRTKLALTAQ